jgi:hypothetical protein
VSCSSALAPAWRSLARTFVYRNVD